MKKIFFSAVVMASIALASCNNKTAENKPAEQKEQKGVNIKLAQLASKTDYSCKMTLDEGSIADTASYHGKLYGFCSSECKADFMKDPESHLAQK
ncbi:MAG: hypothetical protein JWO06_3915 [Bacteroidota bacterium]|nr:hypothetical protein [Bacteroidota bacterium]